MVWLVFAISGALFDASYYALIKRLVKGTDQSVLASGVFLSAFVILLFSSLSKGIPEIGPRFFHAVAATGTLNVAAAILYFRSLEVTDLSLSVPMISFTPIFLIVTSFILLGEVPGAFGVIGIFLIVSGSYALNTTQGKAPILDPFRNMFSNRGVLYMMVVAFLFSVTSNLDKIVVLNSDPIFGSSMISLFIGSVFLAISALKSRSNLGSLKKDLKKFFLIGLAFALSAITINIAYTMQIVPYVISIKRLSIVFTVFLGSIAFKEKYILQRAIGALLMLSGAVLIVIF